MFGWSYDDQPMDGDAVYSIAKIGDESVAAIAPAVAGTGRRRGATDVEHLPGRGLGDEAAAKVGPAGGTVAMEPFDVMDAGRMAFVLDPSGAAVAFWQAGQHIGSSLVNEPGTVIWNELITDNPAAVPFYEQVLGVTTATAEMGEGKYTMFQVGGKEVGGMTPPQMEGVPNHWHVYFSVADADATAAKITELGGSVMVAPFDTPIGKMAVVTDPQGAVFSLFQASTPASYAGRAALREPTMEIPKPNEADKDFFRSVLPDDPAVEVKPMFGNLGAFVHGNMFAGLFGPAVGVRLDDAGRSELEGIDGSGPFGPGRAPNGRVHQPARSLARHARRGGTVGGAGARPCQHVAAQGQEAQGAQEVA